VYNANFLTLLTDETRHTRCTPVCQEDESSDSSYAHANTASNNLITTSLSIYYFAWVMVVGQGCAFHIQK